MLVIPNKSKDMPKPKIEKNKYVCQTCGVEKNEDQFYKSKWTKVWNMSNKHVLFCKECINKLMSEYTARYGEETALAICLALLDMPFNPSTYRSIIMNNSIFSIGLYIRLLNGRVWQYKCGAATIVENQLSKSADEVKEEVEAKWSKSDKQNMKFAISVIGYDPFDDCGMTDNDRKYCFNILAGYCDTEGIQEDGHKIQSVIQITQSQLQCRKLDEMINAELLATCPNENRIKNLTATKTQLIDSITKVAKDNNLSSNYNDGSKAGHNTLSEKIKQLTKDGYEDMKVNLFDINTSDAMKQVADLSNKSIMEQLNFDANDYTEMIKDQREMIRNTKSKLDTVQEENRLLKNKISSLENKRK